MKRILWAAALLVGLVAAPARAEFFEFTSTIEITSFLSPPGASVVSTAGGGLVASITAPGASNSVILNAQSSNPALPHFNGLAGSNIVPLSINPNGFTATADNFDFNFTLRVTLIDYSSPSIATPPNGAGTFTFTGRMTGPVGNFATSLNLFAFGPVPQMLTIGSSVYTVGFSGFTPPGLDNNGTLGLRVTAVPNAVPEPASMAMLGMGGLGLLGYARRRKAGATA